MIRLAEMKDLENILQITRQHGKINYDSKIFVPQSNTENGEIDEETIFHYFQENDLFVFLL